MPETIREQKTPRAREIAKQLFRHENATLVVILVGILAVLAVITKGIPSQPILNSMQL